MLGKTKSKVGVALFFLAFACPVWIILTLVYRLVYFVVDGYIPTFQLATLFNYIYTKVLPAFDLGVWRGIWQIYDAIPILQWNFFQSIFNVAQIALSFIYYLPLELGLLICSLVFLLLGGLITFIINNPQ